MQKLTKKTGTILQDTFRDSKKKKGTAIFSDIAISMLTGPGINEAYSTPRSTKWLK